MATPQPDFLTFLTEELASIGDLTSHRFFGGWQLRSEDVQFAIVMKGTLFFKVEGSLQEELEATGSRPFSYTKSGEQVSVKKYMTAPEDALDDLDLLRNWTRRVIAAL